MAGKGNSSNSGEKKTRARRSPAQAQLAVIDRTRKLTGSATASLQAAQIKATGRLGGNPELVAAYEAFDAVLVNIAKKVLADEQTAKDAAAAKEKAAKEAAKK